MTVEGIKPGDPSFDDGSEELIIPENLTAILEAKKEELTTLVEHMAGWFKHFGLSEEFAQGQYDEAFLECIAKFAQTFSLDNDDHLEKLKFIIQTEAVDWRYYDLLRTAKDCLDFAVAERLQKDPGGMNFPARVVEHATANDGIFFLTSDENDYLKSIEYEWNRVFDSTREVPAEIFAELFSSQKGIENYRVWVENKLGYYDDQYAISLFDSYKNDPKADPMVVKKMTKLIEKLEELEKDNNISGLLGKIDLLYNRFITVLSSVGLSRLKHFLDQINANSDYLPHKREGEELKYDARGYRMSQEDADKADLKYIGWLKQDFGEQNQESQKSDVP